MEEEDTQRMVITSKIGQILTVSHPRLLATVLLTRGELLEHSIIVIIVSYSNSLALPSPPAAAKELY